MERRFCVGLDLGAQESCLAVFDQKLQVSIPLEIQAAKTLPTAVLIESGAATRGDNSESVIVGKRAESRSAKKCEGVLCAYRQMLYASEPVWQQHRAMCEQRWHFSVESEGSNNGNSEPRYVVQGTEVGVERVVMGIADVVCSTLCEYLPHPYQTRMLFVSFRLIDCVVCFGEQWMRPRSGECFKWKRVSKLFGTAWCVPSRHNDILL
jgi:molecular chaperone DnaK (HSP70)